MLTFSSTCLWLCCCQVYACFVSGSLAVIASALDSLLDLVAGFILWFTARQMATHQPDKFPTGTGLSLTSATPDAITPLWRTQNSQMEHAK